MKGMLFRTIESVAVLVSAGLCSDAASAQETKTEISSLVVAASTLPAPATEPLAIEWRDLLPPKAFEDPHEKLSDSQLQDLAYATRVRALIAANKLSASSMCASSLCNIVVGARSARASLRFHRDSARRHGSPEGDLPGHTTVRRPNECWRTVG